MKKIVIVLGIVLTFLSCSSTVENNKKSLVVYYSQTGVTKQVAEIFAQSVDADIDSIVAVNPYNGNFEETVARGKEEREKGELPEIKPLTLNVADYDTIYVGSPIWFGTFAQPMIAWVKSIDLSGKVVVPFCTFGSGGLQTCSELLKANFPNATVLDGYGVRTARIAKAAQEIEVFLIRKGIKSGALDAELPYSEYRSLTEEEQAIFDMACGDYPYPMGTPVKVASRKAGNATEYIFVVESMNAEGNPTQGKVYVESNDSGAEFTSVVR